jgi:hypothetical protein
VIGTTARTGAALKSNPGRLVRGMFFAVPLAVIAWGVIILVLGAAYLLLFD